MRRFLPSLSALDAFESSSRHLNFTRAAEDLGITQSGISRQVKSLEDYLGISLFERHGPRLIMTDAGSGYAKELAQVLDRLEEISIDAVRGRKAKSGLLIGAPPTLGSVWLAPRLNDFAARYPDSVLEIIMTENDTSFSESAVDVAVLRGHGSWGGTHSFELFKEQIAVVASPNLVPRNGTYKPLDFASYRLLQNASRPSFWLNWLRSSELDYRGTIQGPRFAHTSMTIRAAISGLGVALVPMNFVEDDIASGKLWLPFGAPILSGDAYYVVYPERKAHLDFVKLFRDWVLRETRQARNSALT
jgi:DNA-binding transcriptional LysR family regulator